MPTFTETIAALCDSLDELADRHPWTEDLVEAFRLHVPDSIGRLSDTEALVVALSELNKELEDLLMIVSIADRFKWRFDILHFDNAHDRRKRMREERAAYKRILEITSSPPSR